MKGRTVPPPPPNPMQVIELRGVRTIDEAYAAASHLAERGMIGVWFVHVAHDPGCPATTTHSAVDCHAPCQPDFVLMNEPAHASFMQFEQVERQARWN